jgi:hypothetical protein
MLVFVNRFVVFQEVDFKAQRHRISVRGFDVICCDAIHHILPAHKADTLPNMPSASLEPDRQFRLAYSPRYFT